MSALQQADPRPTVIAGAGLAGSLLAVMLAQRGHRVLVLERRPDLRAVEISAGRSINLALSARGLEALERVGLAEAVRAFGLPMRGRMMHSPTGELAFQAYGRSDEAILSVSRRRLNEVLMSEAERHGAELAFEARVRTVDVENSRLVVERNGGEETIDAALIVGADGAFSAVRSCLMRRDRFDFAQTYIEHGYKELTIPPAADGGFRMDPEALHIWPRHNFMLIALPNPDHTFTCTLFLAFEGEHSFAGLQSDDGVRAFFDEHFADAVPHLPRLVEEFRENPTSSLVYTACKPFHAGESVVLIGDAAHAIVPFYGQGMNAAFEDCTALDRILEAHDDVGKAVRAYTAERKPNADAIRDLALYNFIVMRERVADPEFLARRKLETTLEQAFPETYRSLYGMVTFSTVPYAEAQATADAQTAFLDADDGRVSAGLLALAHVRSLMSIAG